MPYPVRVPKVGRRTAAGCAVLVGLIAVIAAANAPQQQNSLSQRVAELESQVSALAGQVASLTSALAGLGQTKTIDVNCASGERIGSALANAQNHPASVVINVFGVCTENIQVARSRVTIRAGSPGAGITALNLALPVVRHSFPISGSGVLSLEGLTIDGGSGHGSGVEVDFGTQVRLLNCTVRNSATGVRADHEAIARLESSTIEGNGRGVAARDGALVFMSRGAIQGNLAGAGLELDGASADLGNNALITNNVGYGVSLDNHAVLHIAATTISANTITGIFVSGGSDVALGGGTTITANGQSGISLLDTSLVRKPKGPLDFHITNNGSYGIVCSVPPAVAQIVGFGTFNGDVSGNALGNINCPISPGPFSQ